MRGHHLSCVKAFQSLSSDKWCFRFLISEPENITIFQQRTAVGCCKEEKGTAMFTLRKDVLNVIVMRNSIFILTLCSFFLLSDSGFAAGKGYVSTGQLLQRFLSYVNIDSQSTPAFAPGEFPMTEGQRELAAFVADEIRGLSPDVECILSDDNYVYVNIPSNIGRKGVPVLGFSCHLDVTPECKSAPVRPSVIYNYQGGDIKLNDSTFIRTDSPEGEALKNCIGKTIVHTDGTTLLGGDDKCGMSVVVSLIETALNDRKFKHGPLQFVICPNEDIGLSAARVDTAIFNPDILFDIDGLGDRVITKSNFTAKQVIVGFKGHDAHPGSAKEMQFGDAIAAASHYIASFPLETRPERSEGLQGYIHPWSLVVDGNNCTVSVRIRYFSKDDGELYDKYLAQAWEHTASEFPFVGMELIDNSLQYENVSYSMHPESHSIVLKASEKTGIPVEFADERGGTTAAMMAAKGLNGGCCIFSGQHAVHSVYEYAVIEETYNAYLLCCAIISETLKVTE